MLQLGSDTFDEDGVQVLRDSADPAQFWYLPSRVSLGTLPDGSPAFTFIRYRPAVGDAGVTGGGFLMFQSVVTLPAATRAKILARAAGLLHGAEPRLAPAPVDTGTVRCVALNLAGPGGTGAEPPPGAFVPVTTILGATKPSLVGDETAVFSLALSEEGATILKQAFEKGATPVGVIYELQYSALTPDLHVAITADFERVYTHFSAGLEAQIYWLRAGIDAGFEKLVQDGAIKIDVIDYDSAQDREEKEKWALDFFKSELLSKWFEPSLDLGKLKGADPPEGLDAVLERLKKLKGGGSSAGGGTSGGGTTGGGTGTGTGSGSPPGSGTPGPLPAAKLVTTSATPDPLPSGHGLSHTPAATGTTETLRVQGPAGAVVTVDGQPRTVDANGTITVDVQPDTTHPVTVAWPAPAPVTETFKLLFTFDQPHEQGFSPSPSNPVYSSYLLDSPLPPDPRFSQSAAPGHTPPPGGAAALHAWLDRLAGAKEVTVSAHASYDGNDAPNIVALNQRLSERRLAVAKGIIANRAAITAAQAAGFSRGRAAGGVKPEEERVQDRVAEITGLVAAPGQAVSLQATLSRAPRPSTTPTDPTKPTDPTQPQNGATPALVSFRLRFVRQEERKTLKLVYDRKKAVQRTYAPQGFIGLLLDQLPDKNSHLIDVDLDDPFFRKLNVDIVSPADFERVGLSSAEVSIDYGDPADAAHRRHEEFRLTANDRGPKRFETYLDGAYDLGFRVGGQYHFDAGSGWAGEKLAYELPTRASVDRTLTVDPGDDLGFLTLRVFPGRIDAGIVEAIDVRLDYDDGVSFARTDTLRVVPGGDAQLWRLRLSNPAKRGWTARFTHHLRNGTSRTGAPITGEASFLPVDDPFTDALDIRAVPLFGSGEVREAFLDVEYHDPANSYDRTERIDIPGTATDPVTLRVALLDPAHRSFRHRVTVVTADGRLVQHAPVEGEETIIGIGLGSA
ncbi:hypothetical protein [Streptomyces acidiscabies]|uniref:hypothetical protein n=1 Tax=Streptomyces acidiscabies TaxID=42234 RepID=UPI00095C3508|nr:hypothetical protein [Streptomyces acidiscabies]GAV39880.1 hypothetical protein Saa2_02767 [Streptomyces acidiscabies]